MSEVKNKINEQEENVQEIEEDEIEEVPSFHSIDILQQQGINVGDINKLKSAGCNTIESVVMHTRKELCSIRGFSDSKVDKIMEAVSKIFPTHSFISATTSLERRANVIKITTGSSQFDQLLGGGIETMSVTEMFGEFRTGKTQLCHTLAVTTQLPSHLKGGNGKVAYIDTEGTFRPERITQIAERFGVDQTAVLDNILIARAYTHEQQFDLLIEVAARMAEDHFRILIIDSVTSLFRVDFSGRGELSERQQKLGKMMNKLIKISEEFNVAVVITNQVMSDPGGGAMFVVDPKKPIGGHVIAHASTTRLYLRKGKGEQRIVKIYDSPNLPEAEATFAIDTGGIIDAKD
ncbi:meiotic recombination protein dmc1, putative [Entamoeba dispar SAW760]|uniref:Meiotic recombination protein dmc1, putative n=1 Tax=Entamoeba dispar (strain ATCC PRA-260 / SAW760) TaxID=370354 RepID=B0ENA1_ENTDS|nr:meiotic recombination protein dmc1, putative [Entamoeba dispar SAW760]EDR23978.1 meiotic recombination protein dmc1, putative [Entamoeba dispar SAW760]|eukprot:EDR23978.1 meiotic recombination protein dmc1, putative [Entamoeba dispar SAW760]